MSVRMLRRALLGALVAGSLLSFAAPALAQSDAPRGGVEEMEAVDAARAGKYVRARELAEEVLEDNPDSVPGLFAMASALHYGEGNLPRAAFHVVRARKLLEKTNGLDPAGEVARYWYLQLLTLESFIHSDMDKRILQLEVLRRRDEVYEARPGDHIWALIKLRRWDAARAKIREAIGSESRDQVFKGYNGLCALEFELRRREEGYRACRALTQEFKSHEVAWSNAAESAMVAFRHSEAENFYLKATELANNSYGSPWRSLAMIYLLEGRFTEALSALKRAQKQRMRRLSYTHQQDQASMDMATASLMLALGRGEDAERMGRRVYERPDRAGGTSASSAQGELSGALLFYAALQMRIAERREEVAALPWYRRWFLPDAELRRLELEAWTVKRGAVALLASEQRLVELLRPHMLGIVNVEVWLMGAVAPILGTGVTAEGIRLARGAEEHDDAEGYFDALATEVALKRGDEERALASARQALVNLPKAEVMLRARVAALGGQAAGLLGEDRVRDEMWDQALADFPAAFRLLDLSIPVTVKHQGGLSEDVADAILRSPRFVSSPSGLTLEITRGAQGLRLCLYRRHQALHGCAEVPLEGEDEDAIIEEASASFHDLVMSPKLDLSQADVRSLDGSLATGKAREEIDEVLKDVTK